MLPSRQLFFTQLMEMFDVVDFPVAGYEMPGTVTQLHLLVTDSALDYRSVMTNTRGSNCCLLPLSQPQ